MRSPFDRLRLFASWRRCERGAAAVEFAIFAPLFLLILTATVDFGSVLYSQFRLNQAVSAAANFALVNGGKVDAEDGAALASQLVSIIGGDSASSDVVGASVVNHGPKATVTGGQQSASGTASAADLCYCPGRKAGAIDWGSAVSCGDPCVSGGTAGKFVWLDASLAYRSIFGSYGIMKDGTLSSDALVKVE